MAIHAVFHEPLNFALMTGSGKITAQDFKDYILEFVCKNPKIKTGFLELADMRGIEGNEISLAEMLEIVQLEVDSQRPQPSKLAFVVRDDSSFGAARQYASHVMIEGKTVHVYYDMHDAKSWLGISEIESE